MEKVSIMEYLPEPERIKLMNLIKKLGQETMEKEKYKKLYEKILNDYEKLKADYQELQEKNTELKAKISTSRLAISKAKQAYNASRSAQKNKRKYPNQNTEKDENSPIKQGLKYQFEDHSGQKDQRNTNQATMVIPRPPRPEITNSLRSSQVQSSFLNQTSSSRKQEIISMKEQIKQLTNSMKKKERDGLKLSDKMKMGEQILRRFKKSKQKKKNGTLYSSEEESENDSISEQAKRRTQIFLRTPQQSTVHKKAYNDSYTEKPSIKIHSQQSIANRSEQNQQKQDIHPNKMQKRSQNYKERETDKKVAERSSQVQKKSVSNNANLYDESFFDLIKQLNDQ